MHIARKILKYWAQHRAGWRNNQLCLCVPVCVCCKTWAYINILKIIKTRLGCLKFCVYLNDQLDTLPQDYIVLHAID